MNRTIHKWRLVPGQSNIVKTDPQARVLLVANQNGWPAVWIEVDRDGPVSHTTLQIVGTGHDVPEKHNHVGSCVCGEFVWHLYAPAGAFVL